jgi:hypothetical protein
MTYEAKQGARFEAVKTILDALVAGREGDLKLIHGDSFSWRTKDELLSVVVDPGGTSTFRLIDPELARQKRAKDTFLYIALARGVDFFPRMPLNGPFATDEQMLVIENWINDGMPD